MHLSASAAGWIALGAAAVAAVALLAAVVHSLTLRRRVRKARRATRRRQGRPRRLRGLAAGPHRRSASRSRRGGRNARTGRPPHRRHGVEDGDRPLRRLRELRRPSIGVGGHARLLAHRCRPERDPGAGLRADLPEGARSPGGPCSPRDGWRCVYCGTSGGRLTLDHVVPRSKGGESIWENVVTACAPCNLRKGDRTRSRSGWSCGASRGRLAGAVHPAGGAADPAGLDALPRASSAPQQPDRVTIGGVGAVYGA